MSNTSDQIRLARTAKRMSQPIAAKAANIQLQTLVDIEKYRVIPSGETTRRIITAIEAYAEPDATAPQKASTE